MKLWNFLERVQGIGHKVIYIENYTYEKNIDGSEYHCIQINVEDVDSETIEATHILQSDTLETLKSEIEEIKNEFEGDEVIECW
jgi:hypothetical protein